MPDASTDPAAAYLADARKRWDAFGEGDATPHLVAALEAVLRLHREQDKPVVTTNLCGAHDLKSLKYASGRAAVLACPACIKTERQVCVTCHHECPDNDEWPCVTYRAISAELLGEEGSDERRPGNRHTR